MSTLSHMTAEQLAALPDNGNRYELIRGELNMMSPAGGRHGRIAMKLARRIGNFVEQRQLGETFAAETGFLLESNPDTVRAPDIAYVSEDTLGDLKDHAGYLPLVPELVAEVISPNDRSSEVERKATAWVQAGVACVLVVDPQTKTVRRYGTGNRIQVWESGSLDLNPTIPGLVIDLDELFS
jgi:Uma2 family endonuclease